MYPAISSYLVCTDCTSIANFSGTWTYSSFKIWSVQMPLHTIIEIQMGVTGIQEKRYKLMETQSMSFEPDLQMNGSLCRFLCFQFRLVSSFFSFFTFFFVDVFFFFFFFFPDVFTLSQPLRIWDLISYWRIDLDTWNVGSIRDSLRLILKSNRGVRCTKLDNVKCNTGF